MKSLSVVCVDGRPGKSGDSLAALQHSAERIGASDVVLFGCEDPVNRPSSVRFLPIAPLGYLDYSAFMLYALGRLVRAEHILIVQADGWVVDETCWSDDFLEFDYVGAPTHRAWVDDGDGAAWRSRFSWVAGYRQTTTAVVMNGGFSLRSKRCLRAPADLKLPMAMPPFGVEGYPLQLASPDDVVNEDVQLCVTMRALLEGAGLKFAPLESARNFAFEQVIPGVHDDFRPARCFGQHNRLRRLTSAFPPTVSHELREREVDGIFRERDVIEDLIRLGYRVEFAP